MFCPNVSSNISALSFTVASYHVNGTVRFSCAGGWTMVGGDGILTCGADGHWIGQVPGCKGKHNVVGICIGSLELHSD